MKSASNEIVYSSSKSTVNKGEVLPSKVIHVYLQTMKESEQNAHSQEPEGPQDNSDPASPLIPAMPGQDLPDGPPSQATGSQSLSVEQELLAPNSAIDNLDAHSHYTSESDSEYLLIPASATASSASSAAGSNDESMDIDMEGEEASKAVSEEAVLLTHKRSHSPTPSLEFACPPQKLPKLLPVKPPHPFFSSQLSKEKTVKTKNSTSRSSSSISQRLPGASKSAKATRDLKARFRAGETANPKLLLNFESECRLEDFGCIFSYNREIWKVFHTRCGSWFMMAEPYSVTVFRTHCGKCREKNNLRSKGGRFQLLDGFFAKGAMKAAPKARQKVREPCSGISAITNERVHILCLRPGDDGGGGRSHSVIAQELYETNYGQLTLHQKARVDRFQQKEWTFRVDRKHETVYSTKCDNFVDVWNNAQGPHTCATCLQTLRDDSRLRNALNKDLPINKNFKYINKKFNGKSDAERYAKTEGLLELI